MEASQPSALEAAQLVTVIEPEPHGYRERWVVLGARGVIGGGAIFYLCFAYAFFYLRSIDTNHQWQPHGVSAPQGFGAAIAFVAVGAALSVAAAQRFGDGTAAQTLRLRLLGLALVLAVAVVVLQVVEYLDLSFGPASGGYASVFVGWTAMQAVAMLGTALWLEILVAGAVRARRDDPTGDVRMTAVNVRAAAEWWTFLAGAGIVAWIVLYLI